MPYNKKNERSKKQAKTRRTLWCCENFKRPPNIGLRPPSTFSYTVLVDIPLLGVIPRHGMKPIFIILAAGGHTAPPLVDIDGTIFIQLGIFLLLLLALTRLVFRPYLALRQERYQNIEGAKEEAQHFQKDIQEKMATYEEQILQARKEAVVIRTGLRQEGEQKATQIISQAQTKAEADIEASRQRMEKSAQAAQLALRTRADQIAQMIAKKLLGREV